MKKLVLSLVIVAVIAVAFGTASSVYAQSTTPQAPVTGSGYGMGTVGRGVRGGMMGQTAGIGTQDGLLHDEMIAVYTDKLGISVDDLNARLSDGETLSQIAISEGLTIDEFIALRTDVRSQVIAAAVADGTLTQDQADWMTTRGVGGTAGGRGMGARGTGLGQYSNPDCPLYQSAQ